MPVKRSRLKASERQKQKIISGQTLDLRADHHRRFQNALLSLMQSDPQAIIWITQNLPHRARKLNRAHLLLLEARARAALWRNYQKIFGYMRTASLLHPDWPFSENGSLTPG